MERSEPQITLLAEGKSQYLAGQEILYAECFPGSKEGTFSYNVPMFHPDAVTLTVEAGTLLRQSSRSLPTSGAIREGRVRLFFIYNPQLSEDGPAASVRTVFPPVIRLTDRDAPACVWVSAKVAADGTVIGARSVGGPSEGWQAAEAAVLRWEFSAPITTTENVAVRVPVIFQKESRPGRNQHAKMIRVPDVTKRLSEKEDGQADLAVHIAESGRVKAVEVFNCTNPRLLEIALDRYLGAKYDLKTIEGGPRPLIQREVYYPRGIMTQVDRHINNPPTTAVVMRRTSESTTSSDKNAVWKHSPLAQLIKTCDGQPLTQETLPRIQNLPRPSHLLENVTSGFGAAVRFEFTIDEYGRARLVGPVQSLYPALIGPAQAFVDAMQFEPPYTTRPRVFSAELDFDPERGFFPISDSGRQILALLKDRPTAIVNQDELDVRPVQVVFSKAVFPSTISDATCRGEAVIEFFLDRKGQLQLTRIVRATAEEFGYAAAQAATVWRFTPPKKNGKVVIARMRTTVQFDAESEAKTRSAVVETRATTVQR